MRWTWSFHGQSTCWCWLGWGSTVIKCLDRPSSDPVLACACLWTERHWSIHRWWEECAPLVQLEHLLLHHSRWLDVAIVGRFQTRLVCQAGPRGLVNCIQLVMIIEPCSQTRSCSTVVFAWRVLRHFGSSDSILEYLIYLLLLSVGIVFIIFELVILIDIASFILVLLIIAEFDGKCSSSACFSGLVAFILKRFVDDAAVDVFTDVFKLLRSLLLTAILVMNWR